MIPLRLKALLFFLPLLLIPIVFSVGLLIDVNRSAVRDAERQLQASILAEVAGSAVLLVRSTRSDAEAVAAALAEAAARTEPGADADPIRAVLAVLATRRSIRAARFEVPAAGVSTVIRPEGEPLDVPSSTDELRRSADERGAGFSVSPAGGILVVPVPARPGLNAAKGYVTVATDLAAVARTLHDIAEQRFGGRDVALLLVDGARRSVASHGISDSALGADVAALPIWKPLPPGAPMTERVGVVSEFSADGVAMVGAIESVPELAWAVAMWRPEPVAYAALSRMRDRGVLVAAGAALIAILAALFAARGVTAPVLALARQAELIGQRRWRDVERPSQRRDELGALSRSIAKMAGDLEQGEAELLRQEQLRGDLGRFLSKELVEAILRGEHPLALGGERRAVSVVFADVVAFTPMAERHDAKQVVALLNDLFSMLTEIVFRHGGTVDKFIGDCVMAFWNAPEPRADHAARAVKCAREMLRWLEAANQVWEQTHGLTVHLAIGVHTGEAVVGNFGSATRMEYTCIGDTVNVAARLEHLARPQQILGSAELAAAAPTSAVFLPLGKTALPGRQQPIVVYEIAEL